MDPPRTKQEVKIPTKEHPIPLAFSAAYASQGRSSAGDESKDLSIAPETGLQAAEEKQNGGAALGPREEAATFAATIPTIEIMKDLPSDSLGVLRSVGQEAQSPSETEGAELLALSFTYAPPKSPYPYSIFLSSVPERSLAEETVSQWSKRGLPAYYAKVVFSRGEQYWIYVGCFESRDKALIFKKRNDLVGATVKKTPYANLVGVYESVEEFRRQNEKLKGLGYSGYGMAEPQGKCRLLVGAFLQKERAVRLHEELKSKGIENQIVQR
jgi:cell division septation protein DedD